MTGSTTEIWGDLFWAAAGAAAAFSGLIFVAVSGEHRPSARGRQPIRRQLPHRPCPGSSPRPPNVLVISIVRLTPAIPRGAFAAFILVAGAESAISPIRALREPEPAWPWPGSRSPQVTVAASSGARPRSPPLCSSRRSTPGSSLWRLCDSSCPRRRIARTSTPASLAHRSGGEISVTAGTALGREHTACHLEGDRPPRVPDTPLLEWPGVGHAPVADAVEQSRRAEFVR